MRFELGRLTATPGALEALQAGPAGANAQKPTVSPHKEAPDGSAFRL